MVSDSIVPVLLVPFPVVPVLLVPVVSSSSAGLGRTITTMGSHGVGVGVGSEGRTGRE